MLHLFNVILKYLSYLQISILSIIFFIFLYTIVITILLYIQNYNSVIIFIYQDLLNITYCYSKLVFYFSVILSSKHFKSLDYY